MGADEFHKGDLSAEIESDYEPIISAYHFKPDTLSIKHLGFRKGLLYVIGRCPLRGPGQLMHRRRISCRLGFRGRHADKGAARSARALQLDRVLHWRRSGRLDNGSGWFDNRLSVPRLRCAGDRRRRNRGFRNVADRSRPLGRDLLGGVYGGYNWQVGRSILGVEGDYTFLNRNRGDSQPELATFPGATNGGSFMQMNASNHWLASVRGRIGWTLDDSSGLVWVYGTGGAAFTNTSYSARLIPSTNPVTPGSVFSPSGTAVSQNQTGWVAGGGVEWKWNPIWILRVEYLHYQFGAATGIIPAVGVAGGPACAGCGWNASWSNLRFDTIRAGVEYKF
jgi:opacity protein-like surface antigen